MSAHREPRYGDLATDDALRTPPTTPEQHAAVWARCATQPDAHTLADMLGIPDEVRHAPQ